VEDPSSEACFSLVRDWLSSCVKSHNRCRQHSTDQLPTRLIYVGSPDDSRKPHLYTTGPSDKDLRYVILSHCWGPDSGQISKLRRDNNLQMEHAIDELSLSKNFRDAIAITRGLKMEYVWIDALCIIQDSPDDWARESAKMAQYYKGGEVMISALASAGADDGILRARTADTGSIKIPMNGDDVYLRPALEDAWCAFQPGSHSEARDKITIQPLTDRAWTLQERLFPSRIIHYTGQQIVWQCKTCIASEDNQYEFKSDDQTTCVPKDLINLQTRQANPAGKLAPKPSLESCRWYKLLANYTSRHITYASDILPGLSGLAREVQDLTEARYLAGIWDGHPRIFLRTLLWNSSHGRKPNTLALNGSPSWSWASIQGKIEYWDDRKYQTKNPNANPKFFLKETTLTTSNPFGQVSGGRIGVRGFYHPYTGASTFAAYHVQRRLARLVIGDKEVVDARHREDDHNPIIFENNVDTYSTLKERVEAQPEPEPVDHNLSLDVRNPDYDWNVIRHIMLFMGRWGPSAKPYDDLDLEQVFLILKPVKGETGAYYERVGIATVGTPYFLDICEAEGWAKRPMFLV
jgi:hypothetical protein